MTFGEGLPANAYYGGYAWCYCMGGILSDTGFPRRNVDRITNHSKTILIGDCTTDAQSVPDYDCTKLCAPDWSAVFFLTTPKHRGGFSNIWADLHSDWQPRAYLLQGQAGGKFDGVGISACNYYYYPKTN